MMSANLTRCSFTFADTQFCVVGKTALWWPERRALFVADLHFEKASWFAARGQMLPPYDSMATLERLTGLARMLDAAHIYCLGDNFHDDDGVGRLPTAALAMLRNLVEAHGLHWIVGNHDPGLGELVPGLVSRELQLGTLFLRHEAEDFSGGGEISGHYHPKARIPTGGGKSGRIVSRPCFVIGAWCESDGATRARLILPAFGALTGGLDVTADAIADLFPQGYRALVPTRERLLSFPFSVTESNATAQLTLWQK